MKSLERAVTIKEVPESCSKACVDKFVQNLASDLAQVVRPAVVLDCSRVQSVDRQILKLLLCCFEEAVKRNGDLRLAGLNQDALDSLESAGAARLFLSFATNAEAVDSYRSMILGRTASDAESQTGEPAAA